MHVQSLRAALVALATVLSLALVAPALAEDSPDPGAAEEDLVESQAAEEDLVEVDSADAGVEPETEATGLAAPEGLVGLDSEGAVILGWAPNGEPSVDGYLVRWSDTTGGPYATVATVPANQIGFSDTAPPPGVNHYVVAAVDADGNPSPDSAEVAITIDPPLVQVASGETFVYGAMGGDYSATHAADGVVETIAETESGGPARVRHDRIDHRWTIPAATGNQTLRVVATAGSDGGDADDGFAVDWSTDRVRWTTLTVIPSGESIDRSFALGALTGVVHIRVVDTDRTPKQKLADSVSVDLLEVTGDGADLLPEPEPSEVVVELSYDAVPVGDDDADGRVGAATATVRDDLGNPVEGAIVDVVLAGDFDELVTIVTGPDGTGSGQTVEVVDGATATACVEVVIAGELRWVPGEEAC